jgi:hypothetical protein
VTSDWFQFEPVLGWHYTATGERVSPDVLARYGLAEIWNERQWVELHPDYDRRWWQFWKPKLRRVYVSICEAVELTEGPLAGSAAGS